MNWPQDLKNKIKTDVPLARYTTFKIGGSAKYWFEPEDIFELKEILVFAKRENISVFIIGSGSNLLVKDKGFKGLVIKLSKPYFSQIKIKDSGVCAGAGVRLSQLIKFSQEKSLAGLEFLAGIPGTLGGALTMNAGAFHQIVGDITNQVTVMDFNGKINTLKREDLDFGYRSSSLAKFIILESQLQLKPGNKAKIAKKIKANLYLRKCSQNYSLPSAGCVFKNPDRKPAGALIEACGLKGKSCGQAIVSLKHANFILNRNKAKARDVLRLMRLIQQKVKNKFKINLEPEIKILG